MNIHEIPQTSRYSELLIQWATERWANLEWRINASNPRALQYRNHYTDATTQWHQLTESAITNDYHHALLTFLEEHDHA